MSDVQEQVQETLEELVASGAELGIQAVAYRDGVKVVDAVAGVVAPDGSPSRRARSSTTSPLARE
jgi:hypothetical protein